MKIKEKVALVLGGTRGVGRAVARALGARGAKLVLPYHTDWPEDAGKIQEEFAGHLVVRADLREKEEVEGLISRIRDEFGALHILINNIERGGMPVVHGSYDREVNRAQWDLEMATTLKAKWLVVHHALPLIKESGSGTIINMSSIAAIVGRTGPAGLLFSDGYGAANRAITSFTETWAREGAPDVRVNELMLGICEARHGEGTKGWDLLSGAEKEAIKTHTLLERTGTLDDVVRAILFMVEDAGFMTGAVLRLDGGYVLGSEKVPPMPDGVLS
jgi:3-oxoacyl-[acyl-carrier protein] reductase